MLRYEKGQLYKPHHDADQDDVALACGPRILTFFLYLSDVDEGERIVRKEILDIPFTLPLTLPLSSFLSSFFTLTRLPHFFPPIHLPPLPLSLPFLLLTYSPFLPSSLRPSPSLSHSPPSLPSIHHHYIIPGGETHFPLLDLTVTPKKGKGLLWPSTYDYDPSIVRYAPFFIFSLSSSFASFCFLFLPLSSSCYCPCSIFFFIWSSFL